MPARRLLPLLVLVLALALAACGDDSGGGGGGDAEKTAEPAATTETTDTGCQEVDVPKPRGAQDIAKPKLKLDPAKTYTAEVETNCGSFAFELAVEEAPKTSAAFTALARKGFFDGLTFHRVVPGFVIQGGDPAGDGTGGPGFKVREAPPQDLAYSRGVVAMAKGGTEAPGTSGSQFFVVTAEDAGLPPEYALLGRITEGDEVVQTIGVTPTDGADVPVQPVVIESLEVTEG